MAKKTLKSIFKKARRAAGAPGRVIAGAYYDSKVRVNKKKNDQIVDDFKTVRAMEKSGVTGGSLQDPYSYRRRKMRVDDFTEQSKNPKPKRKLFNRNK